MHQQDSLENIVGKEEIARNEQFLLIPQCNLLNLKIVSPFVNIFDIISLFAVKLEEPKIGMRGKGLTFNVNCHCTTKQSNKQGPCTYFHVMTILSFNEPFTLMLTVINCGFAENKSFVSQLFCPRRMDLNARTSTP